MRGYAIIHSYQVFHVPALDKNMDILIKSVPKKKIRNDGVGDYKKVGNRLEVLVADRMPSDDKLGVAVHELTEALLVLKRGIPLKKIDAWDKKNKEKAAEPGNMKGSPYKKEHKVASSVEKILLKELRKKKRYNLSL